jgi:hypothetical protein
VSSRVRRYGDCWIRCVAIPQTNGVGTWDCVVYVFVSEPSKDWEPSGDSCFQTVLHGLSSEARALAHGLRHAQNLIDTSKQTPQKARPVERVP